MNSNTPSPTADSRHLPPFVPLAWEGLMAPGCYVRDGELSGSCTDPNNVKEGIGNYSPQSTIEFYEGTQKVVETKYYCGYLKVPSAGTYTIMVEADDGFDLRIHGAPGLTQTGTAPMRGKLATAHFGQAGFHLFKLKYYDTAPTIIAR